jgi:hypothetical protein
MYKIYKKQRYLTHISSNCGTVSVTLCLDGGVRAAPQVELSVSGTNQVRVGINETTNSGGKATLLRATAGWAICNRCGIASISTSRHIDHIYTLTLYNKFLQLNN